EPGDIILVRGNTPIISRLIRWFTDSEYTHVGIALNAFFIYEIDINKRMGIHLFEHEDYDVFRSIEPLTKEQKQLMKDYTIERTKNNTGYDYFKIIGFALEKFFKFPVVFNQVNKQVCSEIVDIIYKSAGIDLVPNRPLGHVRPSDIAQSKKLYKVIQESS